ncbi:hypothetical protein R3I93_019073 [Phoxinus phoxinus]|uniref:Uncharacterized protein n=1 Tax=Phoxinus phoxinus TaxID=58324 RepID=A0AAN9GXX7_9TELE
MSSQQFDRTADNVIIQNKTTCKGSTRPGFTLKEERDRVFCHLIFVFLERRALFSLSDLKTHRNHAAIILILTAPREP